VGQSPPVQSVAGSVARTSLPEVPSTSVVNERSPPSS